MRGCSVFMLALCIYVLAALAVEAVLKPDEQTRRLLAYADTALCVVFLADFGWSLYRAENRTRYFLTWGWVDLLSSIPTLDLARWGRAARAARLIRLLRGIRATRTLVDVALQKRAQSAIVAAALVSLLLLLAASISILQMETAPDRTSNPPRTHSGGRSRRSRRWATVTAIRRQPKVESSAAS